MALEPESENTHPTRHSGTNERAPRRSSRKGFVVLEAESGLRTLIERLRRRRDQAG